MPQHHSIYGPIQLGSNGRYFTDDRGEPFFWLSDNAWPLFTEYPRTGQALFAKPG